SVSADTLHFAAGAAPIVTGNAGTSGAAINPGAARIGMIDGAPAGSIGLRGMVTLAGFARGAGHPSNHGSAVASLMLG
ncbi:hypothetical protein ABTO96_19925, partial [Acinetobacter baumannii]